MGKYFRNIILMFLFATTISMVSCRDDDYPPVDPGYTYFPDNVGHWAIYRVDSAVWNSFYANEPSNPEFYMTFRYYIKEIIESHFTDNQGRLTQRIERYRKDSIDGEWYYADTWFANLTATTAEKVEENIRYVKLVFPVRDGKTWNGNTFNYLGEQEYFYDKTYNPLTVNNITYDSTVTVIEKDYSNIIEEYNQYEVYAKNTGMIYKRFRAVEKMKVNYEIRIKGGVDYAYSLESYGDY